MTTSLQTPIVLLIFNRPESVRQVFEAIRPLRPRQLLVVADGPRMDRPGEAERCAAARAVVEQVDWECELLRHYSDVNLGCKERVSSGLSWVFEQVEEAIILEDDCVPHPTFFRFCEELLAHYRTDERVMAISGNNFQFGRRRTTDSYYFSRYNHCWGWATWRRAWQHYDGAMAQWPRVRQEGWLKDMLGNWEAVQYWGSIFQATYEERINSWAYRWTLSCWLQSGLTILPTVNLVSNIGFDAGATHTTGHSQVANLPTHAMTFPLQHPPFMVRDAQADAFTQKHIFGNIWVARILGKVQHLLRGRI